MKESQPTLKNKFQERLDAAIKKQAELSDSMAHGKQINMKESQINEIHDLLISLEDKFNNGLARNYEVMNAKLIKATKGHNITLTPGPEIEAIKSDIYKIKNHLGFNQSKQELEDQIEFIVEAFPDDYASKITDLLRLNLAGYPAIVTRNYLMNISVPE